MPPTIDQARCMKCGLCAQICPLDVLFQDKGTKEIIVRYPDECWHCRACAIDCPAQCITIRYPLSHLMLHTDGTYEEDNPADLVRASVHPEANSRAVTTRSAPPWREEDGRFDHAGNGGSR